MLNKKQNVAGFGDYQRDALVVTPDQFNNMEFLMNNLYIPQTNYNFLKNPLNPYDR